jgi:hypothetical protein
MALCGAVPLVAAAPAAALPVRFSAPSHVVVGDTPYAVLTGDFDRDGDRDLAATSEVDDNVAIRLGAGNGTFGSLTTFATGNGPRALAAGFFNSPLQPLGDAELDLAVANAAGDSVSVLRGAVGGTFTNGGTVAGVGNGPRALAVGRFNGDVDVDLAVVNEHDDAVAILLGAAGTTFTGPTAYAVGGSPSGVATGDFDADGDTDLAVANLATDDVSVLRGGGNGTFAAAGTFAAGNGPRGIATGDFNRDGDLDLVVPNENSDDVSILRGRNGASFAAPLAFPAGDAPRSVAVGDFTRDGDLDLAVADSGLDGVSVLVGGRNGRFSPPATFAAGNSPFSVAAADLDRDGEQDLVTANLSSDDVSVLRNTTPPQTTVASGPSGPSSDATPTFAFAADEPGAKFACSVDGSAFAACPTPFTTAPLADGPHSLLVRATDPAGNADASPASRTFQVDATAPATAVDSGPAGLTADATPTFGFSSDEPATFACRVDGAAFAACAAPYTTPPLADGTHRFEVRATDAVGNADATPASRSLVVDTTPPETRIASGPRRATTDRTPAFRFSGGEPGAAFACRVDGAAFSACSSPFTAGRLRPGRHTFQVFATDAAGNVDATPAGRSFLVLRTLRVDIDELWAVGGQASRALRFVINRVPTGAGVSVRCNRDEECGFAKRRVRPNRRGRANMIGLLRGRELSLGTVVEVRVTARNAVAVITRYRVVSWKAPRKTVVCLRPGEKRPGRCPRA